MVSITPFGRDMPRSDEQAIDLTILAGGGPVWNCGYDDHSLPPVRGGGNQGYHTGSHFGVMGLLVALLYRDRTGEGQHIDVNMHAAANVTTEAGSYTWLVSREIVQRQTGRHAGVRPSQPTQIQAADGRYALSGIAPRTADQFRRIYEWLTELNLLDELPTAPLLEVGMALSQGLVLARIADDDATRALFEAGRDAVNLLAHRLPAYEFFTGGQQRGFQFGIIYSPEEALENPHFAARGFVVEVEHPELGRTVRYPGAPYRFNKTPWQIRRRAPLLGEDNDSVFSEAGIQPG
jgi:crotonobetainyl-CoA:carnitine CoA-transferase CaiB-like acyl-CoA transferase